MKKILNRGKGFALTLLLFLILLAPLGYAGMNDRIYISPVPIDQAAFSLLPDGEAEADYNLWEALRVKQRSNAVTCTRVGMQKALYDELCTQLSLLAEAAVLPPLSLPEPLGVSQRIICYDDGEGDTPRLIVWEILAQFDDRQMLVYMDAHDHAVLELHILFYESFDIVRKIEPDRFIRYLERFSPHPEDDTAEYGVFAQYGAYEISLMFYSAEPESGKTVFYIFLQSDAAGIDPDGKLSLGLLE